jgi:uncharacterized protein YgfB (UPF0149 family)
MPSEATPTPAETAYAAIDALLNRAGSPVSAADAHGCLCGLLAVQPGVAAERWLEVALEETDPADSGVDEARRVLARLFEAVREQIKDPELGFGLLLPGDEQALAERTRAMADWVQGFLYGLALGGLRDETRLPEDSAEILKDFAEIAQAQFEVDEDEENEVAYAEVSEYIRVGVLVLTEELKGAPDPRRLH